MVLASVENPSFKFSSRLMSRCRMLELKAFSMGEMLEILARACQKSEFAAEEALLKRIAHLVAGDARAGLLQVEMLLEARRSGSTLPMEEILVRRYVLYDR